MTWCQHKTYRFQLEREDQSTQDDYNMSTKSLNKAAHSSDPDSIQIRDMGVLRSDSRRSFSSNSNETGSNEPFEAATEQLLEDY